MDRKLVAVVFLAFYLIGLAFGVALGGWLMDVNTNFWAGADLPFWADCCLGLVLNAVNLTAALVALVLMACGVSIV